MKHTELTRLFKPEPDMKTRRSRGWFVMMVLGLLVLLGACSGDNMRTKPVTCARARLSLASSMFDEARAQLVSHYTWRTEVSLAYAYHASRDSMFIARSTRSCYDFSQEVKRDAVELIRINRVFQTLVMSNMRDQDPGVVAGLLGDQYREVFKNDIR